MTKDSRLSMSLDNVGVLELGKRSEIVVDPSNRGEMQVIKNFLEDDEKREYLCLPEGKLN